MDLVGGKMTEEWGQEENYYSYIENGFHCEIKRVGELGHLCGYVILPKGHKYYGLDYDDIPVSVHGGLTYSTLIDENWVIGFDCAHGGDLIPYFGSSKWRGTYKNVAYVKNEITKIIKQL
jgi:hypothetical protein